MKKAISKLKIYLISVVSILVTSIVISLVGFSFAAYLNTEQQNQTININMDYSQYFDGNNSNAESKTYAISTSDHLRNLSKLVAIGAFTPDFKFILTKDITFDGEPLIPIGSDNTPFYSTFDGQGHTIKNLAVVGSDLADVGMFGYVANGATIKNFLMNYPYVTAKGTYLANQYTTDAFLIRDNNPFRTKYSSSLDALAKTIKLEVQNASNATDEFSDFKISYTLDDNIPFTVKTYVNKTGYVTSNDGINFTRDESYNKASSYFTVEVYVEGLVEINDEYFYSRYTLERFKIYYKTKEKNDGGYTPIGFIQNVSDPKCYRKTIEVPPTHIASGTATCNYYNQHVVFAGIVCGHLDGQAEYIGVSNGTLYADSRSFRSNSVLIGKRIDDDDYSSLSNEYIHVDKANITTLNWKSPSGFDSSTKNKYISNIYSDQSSNNFSTSAENYVRIYGSQNQSDNTGGVRLETLNIDGVETKTLAFYDSIDCYLTESSGVLIDRGTDNMFKNNCISMWITMESTSGFGNVISELLNSSGDFYIKFKFNYILFDNNEGLISNNYSDLKIKMYSSTKRSSSSTWGFKYYSSGSTDVDGNLRPDGYYYALGINENSLGDGNTTINNGYLDTTEYYNSLSFKGDEAIPLSSMELTKNNIHEKEIVVVSNPKKFNTDYGIAKRTPLFCFGFDIPANDAEGNPTAKINLVDFNVTLSSIKGNYSSDPLSVDYYSSQGTKPSFASNTWSNWPQFSNVKVSINCFSDFVPDSSYQEEKIDDNGNVSGGHFKENYPAMSSTPYVPSTYKIVMTRSSNGTATVNNVTCTYSMGTTSESNKPKNAEGYTEANIIAR